MTTKKDIFARYLSEYLKTGKERKGEILNHVCDVVQVHRKAAIRKFGKLQMKYGSSLDKRGRSVYYTSDSVLALKTVWEAGSEVCGELIHPIIPEYVKILRKDNLWEHDEIATAKLLEMSEATIKRKTGAFMKAGRASKEISSYRR